MGLKDHIDCAVSAAEVGLGRPYPYMVQKAMRECEVMDAKTVQFLRFPPATKSIGPPTVVKVVTK